MTHDLTVHATLENTMRFDVKTGSGYHIAMDATRDIGGEDSAPSPMEVVLAGLVGCLGITVLSILYKRKQYIKAYEIRTRSQRATTHPKVFTHITIEHHFTGTDLSPQAVKRAIDLSEERYCGVSAMLGKTATLVHTFSITEG